MKGFEYVSFLIITLSFIASISITLFYLRPFFEKQKNSIIINEAIDNFEKIQEIVYELLEEASGSQRFVNLKFSEGNVYIKDGALIYEFYSDNLPFEDFEKNKGNIFIKKSGNLFRLVLNFSNVKFSGNIPSSGEISIYIKKETSRNRLSNWQYRIPIIINNTLNSNTLTDYQVLITLDTASLISQGKMRSDCGDIRFTDSDGTTLLNYWIESGCNSANTRIWVKVPNIPASSTKTIYLYYGNPSATSASNGDLVFDFFDDFIDNRNQWVVKGGSGSITTFNGISVLYYTGGSCQYVVETAKTVTAPAVLEAKVYSWSAESSNGGFDWPMVTSAFGTDECGGTSGDWYLYAPLSNNNANARLWRHSGTTYTNLVDKASSHPTNTWVRWTLVRNGPYVAYYRDGVKIFEYTDSVILSQGPGYIAWREGEIYIDWIAVRKYTSPEPTISLGDEENQKTQISIFSE